MKPRDRFEKLIEQIDDAESKIQKAIDLFDEADALARSLPFGLRHLLLWVGKAKRRRADLCMLRLQTARAQVIGMEAHLRTKPAEPGPWERQDPANRR